VSISHLMQNRIKGCKFVGGMKIYSERIRQLRRAKDLSQEELAHLAGTSQRQISKYETGENEPTVHVLIALADALDTTTDYLVGLNENPLRIIQDDLSAVEKEAIKMIRRVHPNEQAKVMRVLNEMTR
jgi:transcriptional regulator with XRE-family HTH domain